MSSLTNLKTRLASIREKASETMGQVLQTAEVAAGAGGFAWANGRYGQLKRDKSGQATSYDPEIDVVGVPADIGAAVVLHGLGFTGMLGKHKEHAHNIADGALASYLARTMMTMGLKAKNKARGSVEPQIAAADPKLQQVRDFTAQGVPQYATAYAPGYTPWQGYQGVG